MYISKITFKILQHLFEPVSFILAQWLNGWVSAQLTIVLLKMDQIGSLDLLISFGRIC